MDWKLDVFLLTAFYKGITSSKLKHLRVDRSRSLRIGWAWNGQFENYGKRAAISIDTSKQMSWGRSAAQRDLAWLCFYLMTNGRRWVGQVERLSHARWPIKPRDPVLRRQLWYMCQLQAKLPNWSRSKAWLGRCHLSVLSASCRQWYTYLSQAWPRCLCPRWWNERAFKWGLTRSEDMFGTSSRN